ncbi:SET and MYND domain-containing protein DDB_G0273589-like [Contarinia nasturtii]|uniref:SET and MYND domain-containing protein DDB_G0273589-like n=1 Tax=Contarinia nasturtii TaxID=265458 RepID=UPI0012D38610|nr:SET and MYND domain-containing protein DDB_G0273589-like [Contarinia nasturtii]
MLWQKESKKGNALYVDIMKSGGTDFELQDILKELILSTNKNPLPKKCDSVSVQKRKEGNEYYAKQDWPNAMEKYNESLCFATVGSKNISLAYANRASCFLQMKMYKKCLKDIEFAKEAGYPANLMTKLDQRKANCLQYMNDGVQCNEFEAKLSFDPNQKFPCMANVLDVEEDINGNTTVVAKEDIMVGQVLVVERSFISVLFNRFGSKCNICLKSLTNLMPCDGCAVAMFCSVECQKSVIHKYECGSKWCDHPLVNISLTREIRTTLSAINIFSTAGEMMDFIEQTIQDKSKKLPENLADNKSKYRAYLRQQSCVDCIKSSDYQINPIYDAILKIPKINEMFNSKKHRRFLMHLIAQHGLLGCHEPCCNSINQTGIVEGDEISMKSQINNAQSGLMATYFKHSTKPNMLSIRGDGISVGVAVRPIKKGEPILNSCIPLRMDASLRQTSSAKRQQILSDPVYRYIYANHSYKQTFEDDKIRYILDKCISFLRKYGQFEWCAEVVFVMNIYGELMRVRINSQ